MSWKAAVEQDFVAQGVRVYLMVRRADGTGAVTPAVAQPVDVVLSDTDPYVQVEPFLRLPEEAAHALLDALAAHFGGTSDVRALRRDLEAERKRVDRFIDHLIGLNLPSAFVYRPPDGKEIIMAPQEVSAVFDGVKR